MIGFMNVGQGLPRGARRIADRANHARRGARGGGRPCLLRRRMRNV